MAQCLTCTATFVAAGESCGIVWSGGNGAGNNGGDGGAVAVSTQYQILSYGYDGGSTIDQSPLRVIGIEETFGTPVAMDVDEDLLWVAFEQGSLVGYNLDTAEAEVGPISLASFGITGINSLQIFRVDGGDVPWAVIGAINGVYRFALGDIFLTGAAVTLSGSRTGVFVEDATIHPSGACAEAEWIGFVSSMSGNYVWTVPRISDSSTDVAPQSLFGEAGQVSFEAVDPIDNGYIFATDASYSIWRRLAKDLSNRVQHDLTGAPVGLAGPVRFGSAVDNVVLAAVERGGVDGQLLAFNSQDFSASPVAETLSSPPVGVELSAIGADVLAFTVTLADSTGAASIRVFYPTLSTLTGFVSRAQRTLDSSFEPIALAVGVPGAEEGGKTECDPDAGVEEPPLASAALIHVLVRQAGL